jgi:hypothetical protein
MASGSETTRPPCASISTMEMPEGTSFAGLLEAVWPRAYRIAWTMLRNAAEAEAGGSYRPSSRHRSIGRNGSLGDRAFHLDFPTAQTAGPTQTSRFPSALSIFRKSCAAAARTYRSKSNGQRLAVPREQDPFALANVDRRRHAGDDRFCDQSAHYEAARNDSPRDGRSVTGADR